MTGLIGSLIPFVAEALKLVNTERSRKYIDEINDIKRELLEEQLRGFDADDAKIGSLHRKLKIATDSAYQEWVLYLAKK